MILELKDSSFLSTNAEVYNHASALVKTIDELRNQFENGSVEVVHLQSYNPRVHLECPVAYEIKSYTTSYNSWVADNCTFSTSHYIGRYSRNGNTININPRFGNIFRYLISYATNLYLPQGSSDISYHTKSNSYWLIALLWKSMLNRALTTGQIPKEYQQIIRNQKNYRGHLSIAKHIHENMCDATKFYCSYKKLSMDNTINRTIRTVYGILKSKGVASVVAEFEAYDKYLCSMGVGSGMIDVHDIDKIRYTRLNSPYKSVMELSRTILSNYKAESSASEDSNCEVSYFVDIAELWEMYLLKLLQNNLPSEYHVYSPNTRSGETLLERGMREIRPDIIIEKEKRVVMIIDAKYKNYTSFGSTSDNGIQREDLYQMTTYLYHYGNESQRIVGLFTSPVIGHDNDIHSFSQNKNHRIGLVNISIAAADDDIETLHKYEKEYINNITNLLMSTC